MNQTKFPMRVLGWAFFLISGLFLGVIFFMGRDTILTLTMLTSRNAYLPRFIDKVYLVVCGVIWLGGWMYLEAYYSRAVQKSRLWAAVLRMTGIELVLFFLLTILPWFFTSAGVNWLGVLISTLALLAGAAMLWWEKHMQAPRVQASSVKQIPN